MPEIKKEKDYVEVKFGKYGLFFNRNYHLIALANEIMTGLWFVAGSFLFLSEKTKLIGTILFIIGSTQLLISPILKIIHSMTLRRDPDFSQDK